MSEFIKRIRTLEGDKQIDYNALANLPKDLATNTEVAEKIRESTEGLVTEVAEKIRESTEGLATADDLKKASVSMRAINITSEDGITYTGTIDGLTELTRGLTITVIPNDKNKAGCKLSINGMEEATIYRRVASGGAISLLNAGVFTAGEPVILQKSLQGWIISSSPKIEADDLCGEVSVFNGGTGADNADDALKNLGVTPDVIKNIDKRWWRIKQWITVNNGRQYGYLQSLTGNKLRLFYADSIEIKCVNESTGRFGIFLISPTIKDVSATELQNTLSELKGKYCCHYQNYSNGGGHIDSVYVITEESQHITDTTSIRGCICLSLDYKEGYISADSKDSYPELGALGDTWYEYIGVPFDNARDMKQALGLEVSAKQINEVVEASQWETLGATAVNSSVTLSKADNDDAIQRSVGLDCDMDLLTDYSEFRYIIKKGSKFQGNVFYRDSYGCHAYLRIVLGVQNRGSNYVSSDYVLVIGRSEDSTSDFSEELQVQEDITIPVGTPERRIEMALKEDGIEISGVGSLSTLLFYFALCGKAGTSGSFEGTIELQGRRL